jgi:hypothetical protein
MAAGKLGVCTGLGPMRTSVTVSQFPGLLSGEVKAILCHCREVADAPGRPHQTLAGVRLVTEKQVPDFVRRGIG